MCITAPRTLWCLEMKAISTVWPWNLMFSSQTGEEAKRRNFINKPRYKTWWPHIGAWCWATADTFKHAVLFRSYASYCACVSLLDSLSHLWLSFMFRVNVTVTGKSHRQSQGCCFCQQADSFSSPVDRVEFTRSSGQLGWWCVSFCLSIKHHSVHLQCGSSIVAVNCVHVGGGEVSVGEQRR